MYSIMKKKGLPILGALLLSAVSVSANPVGLNQAQQIASKFFSEAVANNKMRKAPANAQLKLVYKSHGKKAGTNLVYAFDRGSSSGYVIVAGDDRAPLVLGYADSGSFDLTRMPDNMRWWLSQYEQQMQYVIDHPKSRLAPARKAVNVVAPLLGEIAWNQEAPYNANCPFISYYDEDEEQTVSGKCPTGCVATALAQVMFYHQWPLESHGSVSYTTASLNEPVQADLNATYNWDLMLPTYSGVEASDEQKAEVAKLMFNVGAALKSDYTPQGTGAFDIDVAPVLIRDFGYDPGVRYVARDYTAVADYEQGLINEIEAGRPVPYGGVTKKNEGHFFVLDGINEDGYYHVNWGWGGLSNGYFIISSLDPDEQGVGGSTSTFTSFKYHQLYIAGMQKPQEGTKKGWKFTMDDMEDIDDSYALGETVNTTLYDGYNESSTYDTLMCKFYWDLYDADGNIVSQQFVKSDTLALNYGFEKLKTSFVIPEDIEDGQYTMRFEYTQADDDYSAVHKVAVKHGANQYYKVNVEDGDVEITTASGMKLSFESITPEVFKAGETNHIDITFKNTGEDFVGDFNFFLYVNGKKNVYPNYTSPDRVVSIPADSTITLRFSENLPADLVSDDDYVLQCYYYAIDEDGYSERYKAASTKVSVDGAEKPAALYILDDIEVLTEVDGMVPMNDIQLGVNFENEGAEYNAPITVGATCDDDWDYKESFVSDSIVVPADCEGKYVVLKGELAHAVEGQTYELNLYTKDGEFIDPSYVNGVDITVSAPVSSVRMTKLGEGIVMTRNAITAAGATEIAIYDLSGSLIGKAQGRKLLLGSMQKGCYFVKVTTDKGTVVKKVVLK